MSETISFEELRVARTELQEAVAPLVGSIMWFKHPKRSWFITEAGLRPKEAATRKPADVRHLSTTATCLEALHDPLEVPSGEYADVIAEFADSALTHNDSRTWSSEEAAHVYCRVRTLTPILALAPKSVIAKHKTAVRKLVGEVWKELDPWTPERQGIAEVAQTGTSSRLAYPPNAFHTYWAIRMLEQWTNRHQESLGEVPEAIRQKCTVAELWSHQMLAKQTALIRAAADRVDAHQLAWALSTEFLGTEVTPVTATTPRLELYRTAMDAYFNAQLPSGGWPLYEPLFHYPAAGNAYCYTFETLALLLRPALHRDGGQVLRALLRPYLSHLLGAWQFAKRTRIDLDSGASGWCSGHHPHRTSAEAWATAAVFSYLQQLRCLVGYWSSEEAAERRKARRPKQLAKDAAKHLGARGDLWPDANGWSAGRQLAAMFLHPVSAHMHKNDWIDPDKHLVGKEEGEGDQARSAILFGPPGTGKTTLVEALAGAIEWQFVEVLASDFLSRGMDMVPAKADEIFDQLMELDHCVVLFDEIDELIRKRDGESDPFGRFLTTSMLPKLAKLWDQRRVLFFVATNDLDAADPAIKRSQRFDARIFVTPPAFHVKRQLVSKALSYHGKKFPAMLNEQAVTKSLLGKFDDDVYGVFALLRYDQMPELASLMLTAASGAKTISSSSVKSALRQMGEQLRGVEWKHQDYGDPYELYRHHRDNDSHDYRMIRLAQVTPGAILPHGLEHVDSQMHTPSYAKLVAPFDYSVKGDGQWQIVPGGKTYRDKHRLDFATDD